MSRKLKKKISSGAKKRQGKNLAKLQEALTLHRTGDFVKAEATYRQILRTDPKNADAFNLSGTLAIQTGDFARAISRLKKAVALQPQRPDYHANLGTAYREQQQYTEAQASFKRALSIQADHTESLYNLAGLLLQLGNHSEAARCYEQLHTFRPRMPEALEGLAHIHKLEGDWDQALACYQKSIQLNPESPAPYCAMGDIFQLQNDFNQAAGSYQKAMAVDPHSALPYNNLANTLIKQNRFHEALEWYQKAIDRDPLLEEAYVNLAWTFREHGMLQESRECFDKLRKAMPLSPQSHSDLLLSLNYDPSFTPKALSEEAAEWWHLHGSRISPFHHPPEKKSQAKIKIGFISPDFCSHPVGFFLLPLLCELDRSQFEIFCYAEMSEQANDPATERIRQLSDSWTLTSQLTDKQAADKIYSDKIDILIDLAGHTANNRLMVLAYRPAPIQVNWLGYVGTTGLKTIDYRITDAVADPPEAQDSFCEKLLRMPHTFFCYSPPDDAPEIPELPALQNGHITFGSFNNLPKITPEVTSLWAAILHETPGSELLFTSSQFADPAIQARYRELFEKSGIEISRLHFRQKVSHREYLSLLTSVDIGLDPFPHNGHTITCDTLWMGVPVITLRGDRYAGRMGSSILTSIGQDALIAETPDDYIKKAVSLAMDTPRLTSIRNGLRSQIRQCPYCNAKQFSRDFENILLKILADHS